VRVGGREIRRLGLPSAPAMVRLAARGSLRALVCEWDDGPVERDAVVRAARQLAREGSALHWVMLARWRSGRAATICAPAISESSATASLHVDLTQPRASDAETVAALAADLSGPDVAVHLRWREALGRDALGHRSYKALVLDDTGYIAEVQAVLTPPDRSVPSTPRQSLSVGAPPTRGVEIEALLLLGPGET